MWTVLGEKQIIGGSLPLEKDEYRWLEISGVYHLSDKNEVRGSLKTSFQDRV